MGHGVRLYRRAPVRRLLAYQWPELTDTGAQNYVGPILLLKVWSGISSYGGFIGGAGGFAFYVWWKQIAGAPDGRHHDHGPPAGVLDRPHRLHGRQRSRRRDGGLGELVPRSLAMDYPIGQIGDPPHADRLNTNPAVYELAYNNKIHDTHLLAWNLGLIELLWLIPVNALILYLGFPALEEADQRPACSSC